MSPSEELRQAAQHIRDTASRATPGPWMNLDNGDRIIRAIADGSDALELDDSGKLEYVVDEPLIANPANGDHIVLWNPKLAFLVAGWLLSVAIDDDYEPETAPRIRERSAALTIAQAINARQP